MKRFNFIRFWPLIILGILGVIVPWHWFADGRLIAGGDHLFYYNPTSAFYENFFTWINRINFGEPNYAIAFLFPFLSFFKFLQLLGFNPYLSEILWAVFLFLTPGFFMFLLVRDLLEREPHRRDIAAFVAALFYMFNPYIMTDMLQISQRPVQLVLPLLFFLWLRGLRSAKKPFLYAVLFSLATLLTASTGTAPAFMVIIPLAIFLLTFFWLIFHPENFRRTVIFVVVVVVFSVLINLWWLMPALLAYRESGEALQKTVSTSDYTKSTSVWEAFRLFGFWAFRINWGDLPHIPYAPSYYKLPFLFLSYFLTILGLSGLLVRPRRRILTFFSLLFLMGVFLSKGARMPFGGYYEFLFKNFPPFSLFREPYSKITSLSLFSLAVILGLSWAKVLSLAGKSWGYFLTALLSFSILTYSFPIITGLVIQNPSWHKIIRDSLHVQIPKAWFEFGEWLEKTDSEGRILLFPKSSYGVCYKWEMGTCAGQPIARLFLPNQTIRYTFARELPRDQVISDLYESLTRDRFTDISLALRFLGIRYILQQNDLDWQNSPSDTLSPDAVNRLFNDPKRGMKKIKTIGSLDLYSYPEAKQTQLIFATNVLNFVSGDSNNLSSLISSRDFKKPESFYFIGDGGYSGKDFLDLKSPLSSQLIIFPKNTDDRLEEGRSTAFFPQDGVYNVFLGTRAGSEDSTYKEEKISLGEQYSFKVTADEIKSSLTEPLKLGEISVNSGNYQILTSTESSVNLLEQYLSAGKIQKIPLTPGRYIISYRYRLPEGLQASFTLTQEDCGSGESDECVQRVLIEELLVSNNKMNQYQKDFAINVSEKNINLFFKTSNRDPADQSATLEDLSLRKIQENNVFFTKNLQPGNSSAVEPPEVSFVRKSPTLYKVNIKSATGPYFLSFLETYNRNWKIRLSGNTLPEERHFMLNGFVNGWLIKPEDTSGKSEYTLTMEYQSQKLFYASLFISLAGIVFSIVYILKKGIYDQIKKKP